MRQYGTGEAVRFPLMNKRLRYANKRFKNIFSAKRPNLFV